LRAVLGIDAAWTTTGSSGVALLVHDDCSIHFVGAAPSYEGFCGLVGGTPCEWKKAPGGCLEIDAILVAARTLAHCDVDVVAIDMPVSCVEIDGRRKADNALTAAYGNRGAGTHSPNALRPGAYGRRISEEFRRRGYAIATTTSAPATSRSLLEVHPHPALIQLTGAPYRLTYKIARVRKYWPSLRPPERREEVKKVWIEIVEALRGRISGLSLDLPPSHASVREFKHFEDALDAIVAAWVGVMFMWSKAQPFGDETAAIWVPM
jgi:predicted RNase H-like nuclease